MSERKSGNFAIKTFIFSTTQIRDEISNHFVHVKVTPNVRLQEIYKFLYTRANFTHLLYNAESKVSAYLFL